LPESDDVSGPPHSEAASGLGDEPEAASSATAADPDQDVQSLSVGESGGSAVGPEPELLTDPQRRRLMALFRERGFHDREHRLAWTRRTIGRPIDSANDLTVGEASIAILALEAMGLHPEDAEGWT